MSQLQKPLKHLHARAFSQTLASFTRTHLLRTGFKLGLFERLREPCTAQRLALDSLLAPDLLQGWLRAAEAQGLVRRPRDQEQSFVVAGIARWLLEEPDSDALIVLLDQAVESYGPVFERLPDLMRGGVRPHFGSAEEARRAAEAARMVEERALEALTRIPGVRDAKRLLDIGCGCGTYLSRLLQRYRDTHGIGVEQDPSVAEIARANLKHADLLRRGEVRVGDFMAIDLEPGSFDLILLNNNVYYFAPNDRAPLFGRIYSRLGVGGVFAVQLPVISDHPMARISGLTATTAAFDLYLRAHSNLYGLPDLAELHATLKDVGFHTVGEAAFMPGGAARYVWGRKG